MSGTTVNGSDARDPNGPAGATAGDTFGQAMERLEAIVTSLEGDEALGLEEALALYERGVALAGECRRRLGAAQLKLTEIPVAPLEVEEPAPGPSLGGRGAPSDPAADTP